MQNKLLLAVLMLSKFLFYGVACQVFVVTMILGHSSEAQKYQSVKEKRISLELKNVSLKKALNGLEKKTGYSFTYDDKSLNDQIKLDLIGEDKLVYDYLLELSKKGDLYFKQYNNSISVFRQGQKKERKIIQVIEQMADVDISGKITDETGEGLPGASVLIKGTTTGTTTDLDGNYYLTAPEQSIIVVSFVGYKTSEILMTGQNVIDVQMELDAEQLEEVVVVGFGTQESRKVVSSVSQVTGEELAVDKRPVTSIQSALIGSIPGLRGLNANGRPGSTPSFSIRGPSTLNNANILIIIDGFEGNLADLDPQTVESVSILKDAAAVAVYGARGANGVMLVTTKSTKRNEGLSVSYSYNVSNQSPKDIPGTLNSLELMEFENIAVTGDPSGSVAGSPYGTAELDLARSGFYPETVWPEELYDSGAGQQSHNLALQGGSEKTGYLINASYLKQNGFVIGTDDFKRMNLRLKIDTDVTDWLTVGINALITNRITNSTPANSGDGLLGSPFFPVKTVDGIWVDKGSPGTANPIAEAASGSFTKTNRDAVNLQLYAKLKPLKGLTIEQRVSFLKNNTNTRDWDNVYDHVKLDLADPDSYTNPESTGREYAFGSSDSRRLTLTSSSDYSIKSLSTIKYQWYRDNHHVDVLLGFQSEQGEAESFQAGRTGFLLDNLIDMSLGQMANPNIGGGIGNTSGRGGNATTLSYFGRVNYDFQGRYLAEFSFRRDGSSNFLASNRWAFFPALAVGWNIAEESFLNATDFIDKLKLRASYGKAGDDSGVGRRVTQLVTLDVTGYPIGGEIQPRLFLGAPASRDLQWETSTTFNTGLDFSLWKGKLQVNSEYYITNREDILDEVLTPKEFGFGNVPANLYAVKSWGWELELRHDSNIGDVRYWVSSNITNYDNEITDLAGREQPNFAVGQSINDRFGFQTDGFFDNQEEIDAYVQEDGATAIDQSNVGGSFIGGYKFIDQVTVDTNNDGVPDARDGVIDGDDRVILDENSATNLNLGIGLGLSYKGFALSARFYGALDRDQWWNGSSQHEPFLNGTNAFDYQLNYWTTDNPNAFFPVPQGNGIQGYNSDVSHLMFNNEFIKLQNITLSYDFGSKMLDKLKFVRGLNLIVSIENIGTMWTNSPAYEYGWDPELGVGSVDYPLPFTTSFGINVKF
ncbi:TonB-dependent receptor [Reichenbachiella sp. MALMAid0571]|uniref:SusC/RagA family TonB-linked outer membrane protein n=1 Tax=Reichenbachiella sp. MALMAid0571 TaxID=3143939 RepID=UPI0032DEAD7D